VLRASLSGLLSYRGRLTATILAIVLGVGFVTGTLVFTDAMRTAFYDRFARAERGVDVAISSAKPGGKLDAAKLDAARRIPGVAVAEPRLTGQVRLLDRDGRTRPEDDRTTRTLGISVAADPRLRWQEVTSGRLPTHPGEVALDDASARQLRLDRGDTVKIGAEGRIESFTVVGTVDPGLATTFQGSGAAAMPTTDLGRLLGADGYDRVDLVASAGVGQEALKRDAGAALGAGVTPRTGDELRQRAAEDVADQFGEVGTLLLLFAAVALLVAAFVIYNTFTILVAQRSRQLALLRCVGAARGQVFRTVLGEAAVLGLASSLLGIGAGFGVATGLRRLIGLLGTVETDGAFSLSPATAAIGMVTGLGVTLVAAILPARRATKVAPLVAMRAQTVASATRPGRLAGAAALLLLAAGGGGLWTAATSGSIVALIAGGALTAASLVLASPHLVGPAGRVLGAVSGLARRVPGRLAVANATRNPRRTAATTTALMIGVTLLTAFATGAASLKASATAAISEQFPVEFALTNSYGDAVPVEVVASLRERDDLDVVAIQRAATARLGGDQTTAIGIDPGYLAAVRGGALVLPTTAGSLAGLRDGAVAVSASLAADDGLTVGDTLRLDGSEFRRDAPLRVVAIYGTTDGPRSFQLTLDDHRRLVGGGFDTVLVSAAPGITAAQARDAVLGAASAYPDLSIGDQASYVEELTGAVNGLLGLVGGLLALAIVIALLGVANTLGLSVVERVRESALLRTLGLTRWQLRAMLAVEAVVTALLGAALGLGLGLLFARVAVAAGRDLGLTIFVVPAGQLAAGIAGAALIGLLASIIPGRAAARTNLVGAMAAR
jgi:putative ABC transport system permease protein